jgi:hypothetical protein
LTIDKSLKIIPQIAGSTINFNANIIVAGLSGMKLEIMGFNLGIYSISSNVIFSGSYTNRSKVSLIESTANGIDFNNDFYEIYLKAFGFMSSLAIFAEKYDHDRSKDHSIDYITSVVYGLLYLR